MVRIKSILIALPLIVLIGTAACGTKETEEINTMAPTEKPRITEPVVTEPPADTPDENPLNENAAEPLKAGGEDIAELTSLQLVRRMTAGWNLGNTLDSHWNAAPWGNIRRPKDQETMWGNPVTTKEMIDKMKESGFNTVRIPVTWYIFTGEGPEYPIDEAWMDRVQEVVDYVMDNGLFCILNTHHEDYLWGGSWSCGWLTLYHVDKDGSRPLTREEKDELILRLSRIWEQISERFRDYDEHLIFEAVNEPRSQGLRNVTPEMWAEQSQFLNELLQAFIDKVRASGGKNADRHLMVTPFFASVGMNPNDREGRIAGFVDKENGRLWVNDPRDRLIASLHYYEPWGFVTAPSDSQWHSFYYDLDVGSVSGNVNNVFKIFEENFIANGIPVIMGETGAIHRLIPPDNVSNEDERIKWTRHFIAGLKEMGVPSIIWDDGGSFRLFDRRSCEWEYPGLAEALVEAGKTPVK